MQTLRKDGWLWTITFAALLLRLVICMRLPTTEASLMVLPDQTEYLECGRNLATLNDLSFFDPRFGQRVYAYRMPGYPVLVSLCLGNVPIIRFFQCLLDASTALAIYSLARRWLGRREALVAALITAINPFQIYFCGLILSETLFITMMAWGLALFSTVAGICLTTLAILVRPSTILLSPLLASLAPSKRILRVAIAILIECVLLAGWAYRNHQALGEWIWTTTNSGISAYDGLNPRADGSSNQRFIAEMPELRSMNEVERSHYLGRLANDFAIHHPLTVARLAAIKLARFWSPVPLSAEYGSNLKLIAISLIFSLPFDLLVLVGLFFGGLPRNAKLYLVAPALYFSVVHAVGVGSLRYRIPADVPMSIIVASGVSYICGRKLYGQAPAHA